MSDDSTPNPSPPRSSRPRLSELSRETTEDDLWDLDDESTDAVEDPAAGESVPAPVEEAPPEPAEELPEPSEELPIPEEPVEPTVSVDPMPDPTEPAPVPGDPESSVAGEPDPEPGPAPETPKASRKSEDSPEAVAPKLTLPDRRDLISLGIVAVILLALGIWWIAGQFSDIPTTRYGGDQPEFPIKGEYAEVEVATTYWRSPIREGDQRDVARPEVSHIPVVSVKLSGGTGALRAVFRTDTGDFVGDTITHAFENGKFVENRSDTIEFPATDGYETDGDMNGYRVGDDRWKIEILESPGAEASGSRFQSIFIIPVSPAQR